MNAEMINLSVVRDFANEHSIEHSVCVFLPATIMCATVTAVVYVPGPEPASARFAHDVVEQITALGHRGSDDPSILLRLKSAIHFPAHAAGSSSMPNFALILLISWDSLL